MLLACGQHRYYAPEYSQAGADTYDESDVGFAGEYGVMASKSAPARSRGMLISEEKAYASAPAPMAASMETGGSATSFQERMVNYTGEIHLENSQPETVIDTVVQRAVAKGGSVSNRRNGFVSLQIPVAEFKDFFNYILTLGKITGKSIYASDITDAYSDNAARLRIAESTLARLQELLAAAKTEQEKITLLKEIQRVSEQIEQRKLTEKELLRKAAFSTINLWARNTPVQVYRIKISAFGWFYGLPMYGYFQLDKPLKLSVPQNFIETEDSGERWSAASALSAEFLAFERENNPQGTPDFWANAMLEYFKSQYNTELKSEENFSLLRLQSFETEPRVFYIAILKKSDKKTLKIAIARFPSLNVEQKNSEAVMEVLRRAK
jgi:TfoX/Sxy family transcriptional regulator of competence genes